MSGPASSCTQPDAERRRPGQGGALHRPALVGRHRLAGDPADDVVRVAGQVAGVVEARLGAGLRGRREQGGGHHGGVHVDAAEVDHAAVRRPVELLAGRRPLPRASRSRPSRGRGPPGPRDGPAGLLHPVEAVRQRGGAGEVQPGQRQAGGRRVDVGVDEGRRHQRPARSTTSSASSRCGRGVPADPGDGAAADQQCRRGGVVRAVHPPRPVERRGAVRHRRSVCQPALEEPPGTGLGPEQVQRGRRVAGDVAVADRASSRRRPGPRRRARPPRTTSPSRRRSPCRRSAVARTAPCSQPGTSTQTTVTSAARPRACSTAAASATGSRASATATASARPAARSSVGLGLERAPRRRCATRRPGGRRPARATRSCRRPRRPPRSARRSRARRGRSARGRRRRPARPSRARPAGRRAAPAAIDRPNRMAWPSAGTCSERPSQRASPSVIRSGVSDSETRVATRSPTVSPRGDSGPTSSTTPTSMPPDPVTGFCILPRAATISSTSRRTASPSPPCLVASWRKDAASRLRRSDGDPHLVRRRSAGLSSSRWAACGSAPAGSRTRCSPTGEDGRGRAPRGAHGRRSYGLETVGFHRMSSRNLGYGPQVLHVSPVRLPEEPSMTVDHRRARGLGRAPRGRRERRVAARAALRLPAP